MRNGQLADALQIAILNPFYECIDHRILDGLCRYAIDGQQVGGFLTAVLSNDLFDAVRRADAENFASLHEILTFVHQELPAPCWGSPEKVGAWLAARAAERIREADLITNEDGGFLDIDGPRMPVKGDLP